MSSTGTPEAEAAISEQAGSLSSVHTTTVNKLLGSVGFGCGGFLSLDLL